jgi:MoxR-like ATPase
MVLATQNPLEQEGTYPLPEAQLDRFMLKTIVDYPTRQEEQMVMRQNLQNQTPEIKPVVTKAQIIEAQQAIEHIYLDEKVEQYILNIVFATRTPQAHNLPKMQPYIAFGASPRGTINLARAARVHAYLQQRTYTTPEDVQAICYDVLRHRIGLSYQAQADHITTDEIIKEILTKTEVL